jgi:hypothetical protein
VPADHAAQITVAVTKSKRQQPDKNPPATRQANQNLNLDSDSAIACKNLGAMNFNNQRQ